MLYCFGWGVTVSRIFRVNKVYLWLLIEADYCIAQQYLYPHWRDADRSPEHWCLKCQLELPLCTFMTSGLRVRICIVRHKYTIVVGIIQGTAGGPANERSASRDKELTSTTEDPRQRKIVGDWVHRPTKGTVKTGRDLMGLVFPPKARIGMFSRQLSSDLTSVSRDGDGCTDVSECFIRIVIACSVF